MVAGWRAAPWCWRLMACVGSGTAGAGVRCDWRVSAAWGRGRLYSAGSVCCPLALAGGGLVREAGRWVPVCRGTVTGVCGGGVWQERGSGERRGA